MRIALGRTKKIARLEKDVCKHSVILSEDRVA
jgi:hypothetical protein